MRGLESKVAERDESIERAQVQFNSLSREVDNLRSMETHGSWAVRPDGLQQVWHILLDV